MAEHPSRKAAAAVFSRMVQFLRSRRLRWWRRGGAVLLLIVVVEYLVLPQLVGVRADVDIFSRVSPPLIVVALALEACSLLSYSALSRTALGRRSAPSYWTILRVDLTGLGASHLMIGGGAAAAGLRYRLLTRVGVEPNRAIASTAIGTAMSVSCLVAMFLTGLSLNLAAVHPLLGWSLALSAMAGVGGLLWWGRRSGRRSIVVGASAGGPQQDLRAGFRRTLWQLEQQARDIQMTPGLLGRYLAYAFGNWVFDAACLAVCLYAFGFTPTVGQLLWVYGLANLFALLPITPGGLGVVEGVMVPILVAFGSDHSVALLAVLAWRVVEYWLPILVAGLAYLSLRIGTIHPYRVLD